MRTKLMIHEAKRDEGIKYICNNFVVSEMIATRIWDMFTTEYKTFAQNKLTCYDVCDQLGCKPL